MQSGTAKTGQWILEFEPESPLGIEPLMGYTSSSDTRRQVQLRFSSKEEAIAYAQKHSIPHRVEEEKKPKRRQVSYAENFRYDRKIPWTH